MKNLLLTCFVVLLNSCTFQPNISKLSTSKIFIERPENNGFLNIIPCTIQLDAGSKFILLGGQTNFFWVKPGKHSLIAKSVNPYPDALNDSDWKPASFEITITNFQTTRIILEPKSQGSTYIGGWNLFLKNQP